MHTAVGKRFARVLTAIAVALTLLSPLLTQPQRASAAGPYVVDTSTDKPDSLLTDGVCYDGFDGCSLRAALQQATYDGNPTTITFANDLAGSTLLVDNTYGVILWVGDNITVTGESKNITLSGVNLSAGRSILEIEGNNNQLLDLSFKQAPQDAVQIGDFAGVGTGNNNVAAGLTLYQNGAAGVYVFGGSSAGGQNNSIANSKIGTSNLSACSSGNTNGIYVDQGAAGTDILANYIVCNSAAGVNINNTTGVTVTENSIGTNGVSPLANAQDGIHAFNTAGLSLSSNLISSNGGSGVTLDASILANVTENYIGTNQAGTAALPNGFDGVDLTDGSYSNTVGGASPGQMNLISGNTWNGVLLNGSGTLGNVVLGNQIGTNVTGMAAIANGHNGVILSGGAHDNQIGASMVADGNVISGNGQCGIAISGAYTNTVDNNLIGLNAAGTGALGNHQDGICIRAGSTNNQIGGDSGEPGQYISGNGGAGIAIDDADTNTISTPNRIGLDVAGGRVGNHGPGVLISDASFNQVFPVGSFYNGGAGVAVIGSASVGNKLELVDVAGNSGLPLDLGDDGATPNGSHLPPGPNDWLSYPLITAGSGTLITGTACANCRVLVYLAIGNPAASGGGGYFMEPTTADAGGNWHATLTPGRTRFDVTLEAEDGSGNTSELSPRPILFLPTTRR